MNEPQQNSPLEQDTLQEETPITEKSENGSEPEGFHIQHELILLIVFVLTLGGIVLTWEVVNAPSVQEDSDTVVMPTVTSFEECAKYYPVMESYPEQCVTDDGQHFVREIGNELEKSDLIRLSNPRPGQTIESPLTVSGEARGYWFFEATFPVVVTNWDGLIIAEGYATAQDDWMTEEFVGFEATLEFTADTSVSDRGTLILQKANASGLPEHDDALEIPVVLKESTMEPVDSGNQGILPPESGVEGRVVVGPQCPVMQEGGDCPDQPYVTTVVVHAVNVDRASVVAIQTEDDGTFMIDLYPGVYTIAPESGDPFPLCEEVEVEVGPNGYEELLFTCDSGIR